MADEKKKNQRSSKNGNQPGKGSRGALATPRPRLATQFSPLSRLRTEFDRLFDDFLLGWPSADWGGDRGWAPRVDVAERDDSVVVRAEVAGFEPDDFDVEIHGDQLVLCACQSEESSQGEESQWEKRELYQSVPLPAEVDADKIDAHYRNGVLTITLPKTEQVKGRKIEVKS